MVRPKRSQQHPNLQSAIKETAREQIAKNGAAALSLRAIARELKITAPAIYNYFTRRDDLVTALIVDAYNSLSTALAASQETDEVSHYQRILASACAYRTWALTHPAEYSLIFGTPIPNYRAPMEITGPAAAQSMIELIKVLDAAYQDGQLTLNELTPALGEILEPWVEKLGYTGPLSVIHLALACWSQIHGLVSLELNGHLNDVPEDVDVEPFFEIEIRSMLERMAIE